jgi:dipeptidyl aminopeptidase/acylaminoacyl peptidase
MSAAFSPEGNRVITGSADGTARFWDARENSMPVVLFRQTQLVSSVGFSPDGRTAFAAAGDKLYLIEVASERQTIIKGHERGADGLLAVAFTPDGRRVAIASGDTARFWDAVSGEESAVLRHPDTVFSLAVSPDGDRIATGTYDGSVRVWDVRWVTQVRGDELRERVCQEKLAGAQAFTVGETENPVLSGLLDARPCDRRGPLVLDYWTHLAALLSATLRTSAGQLWPARTVDRR